jgi:undecaprenyl-diphosphatase
MDGAGFGLIEDGIGWMGFWATLEQWNRHLFLVVNGPASPSPFMLDFADILAGALIFVIPVVLAWCWLRGEPARRPGLLMAFIAAQVALLINQIIPLFWVHPRPFMIPLGHTYIPHVADSSFPSDHVTFICTIAAGLVCWKAAPKAGWAIGLMAVPVAWARIYLGVHFPADMLGAVLVAAVAVLICKPLTKPMQSVLFPKFIDPLYQRVFAFPIARGWTSDPSPSLSPARHR